MAKPPFVSRDRRIALGELRNIAGFVMDKLDAKVGHVFISAIALRMEALIRGEVDVHPATDIDVKDALEVALEVKTKMLERGRQAAARAKKDTAYGG